MVLPLGTISGYRLPGRWAPSPSKEEGGRRSDFEKRFPEKAFINLSSTAAFIRRLFALNAVLAAIEINKIHIDSLPPEQKVKG